MPEHLQKKQNSIQQALMKNITSIIDLIGENHKREGLIRTPKRFAETFQFLTSGYNVDFKKLVGNAIFHEKLSEIVIIRDIELFSLCEHHLLPFYGKAHVAYIPNGKILGLSKVPRIVDAFARRLQLQERLTSQIAETLMKIINPLGVAVIIEAFHLCMMMRGVEKQQSYTITSSMLGVFRSNPATRQEFLSLLGNVSTY
ncbi:MAG: GTP cyclohydrolase I FolE [Deltaproteobacteria bacterium]|nr:GTP cyclohydrolase I FolE [Deltaproteobacteria bacterium]